MNCPRCGAEMKPDQRYCMKCGALNYDHPDNQKMKQYITSEEIEQTNKDYNDPNKQEYVETVEFAGRTYETKSKKKKGYVDTRAMLLLLVFFTIVLGSVLYFYFYFSITMLIMVCSIFFVFTFYIISAVCIYMKGGYSGFTPIIPFYGQYAYFDIALGNGWLFLLSFIPIVGFIYSFYATYRLGKAFQKNGWLTLLFPFIMFPIIAFGDRASYQGKGVKHEKFIASGKRRNTQLPGFIYSVFFAAFFLCLAIFMKPFLNTYFSFDLKYLIKAVQNDVDDGIYSCDVGDIVTKNGEYYISFSNASQLLDFEFIPMRSPYNGKNLKGYVRIINDNRKYQYEFIASDGERKYLFKLGRDSYSLSQGAKISIPENAIMCKKS